MSISSLDLINQTTLVPNSLLGYSSNGQSALEITPTTITLGGNLTTTPIYVGISAVGGLTTTNPNGLDVNCDLDLNQNDITSVNNISNNGNDLNLTAGGVNNMNLTAGGYFNLNATGPSYINGSNIELISLTNMNFICPTGAYFSINPLTPLAADGIVYGSATKVGLTSDNTSGTYYIPFSKTTSANNNTLFIDDATGPLSYNPSTSTLTASIFSGSATTMAITADNTNGSYNIPFFKTNLANGNIIYIDTVGPGFLQYNPALGSLSTIIFAGSLSAPTGQSATTYTAGTQTLALTISSSVTYLNFAFIMTGDINNFTFTGLRPNGEYYLFLTNTSGTARTVNNVLGGTANIRTSYASPITIPATTGKGVVRILFDGTTYYLDCNAYN
jgi:hypothetical protein